MLLYMKRVRRLAAYRLWVGWGSKPDQILDLICRHHQVLVGRVHPELPLAPDPFGKRGTPRLVKRRDVVEQYPPGIGFMIPSDVPPSVNAGHEDSDPMERFMPWVKNVAGHVINLCSAGRTPRPAPPRSTPGLDPRSDVGA